MENDDEIEEQNADDDLASLSARGLALDVLFLSRREGVKGRRSVTEILSEALGEIHPPGRQEALTTELVYSAVRRRLTLDWIIEKFSGVPLERIEPLLLDILRLGVLQLVYMESVPDYAAVNESVRLARVTSRRKAAGFVNSVLRKVAARRADIPFPRREEGVIEHLSIVHSHPEWLVRRWVGQLGEETAESVCAADNIPPPITARVNILRTSREELLEKLAEDGVEAVALEQEQMIEIVSCRRRISRLRSFREGLFYLQDVSATIPTRMLAPGAGERVLDLCSAPGGKATHIAELMGNRGLVVACDIDGEKMPLLWENIERLGTRIVQPLVAQGTKIDSVLKPDFDRVLIDAPCSNTGVLRRRVEARWRLKERQLKELKTSQRRLLLSGCRVLKEGGVLVYSTCSIEPEENQEVIQRFLDERRDFELTEEKALLPRAGGGDGGYAARLVKK